MWLCLKPCWSREIAVHSASSDVGNTRLCPRLPQELASMTNEAEVKLDKAKTELDKAKTELKEAEAKLEKAEAKLEKAEAKLKEAEGTMKEADAQTLYEVAVAGVTSAQAGVSSAQTIVDVLSKAYVQAVAAADVPSPVSSSASSSGESVAHLRRLGQRWFLTGRSRVFASCLDGFIL